MSRGQPSTWLLFWRQQYSGLVLVEQIPVYVAALTKWVSTA
jgi:hypothetical protein